LALPKVYLEAEDILSKSYIEKPTAKEIKAKISESEGTKPKYSHSNIGDANQVED